VDPHNHKKMDMQKPWSWLTWKNVALATTTVSSVGLAYKALRQSRTIGWLTEKLMQETASASVYNYVCSVLRERYQIGDEAIEQIIEEYARHAPHNMLKYMRISAEVRERHARSESKRGLVMPGILPRNPSNNTEDGRPFFTLN